VCARVPVWMEDATKDTEATTLIEATEGHTKATEGREAEGREGGQAGTDTQAETHAQAAAAHAAAAVVVVVHNCGGGSSGSSGCCRCASGGGGTHGAGRGGGGGGGRGREGLALRIGAESAADAPAAAALGPARTVRRVFWV
jgi:hypothetical protein